MEGLGGYGGGIGERKVFTGHVEWEHLKSIPVHIESVQDALLCLLDVFACGCHDREIGRFEEAPREFKSNAARGWSSQDPRESHCGGGGLWRRVIQMAGVKLKAEVNSAKEQKMLHECHRELHAENVKGE